MGQGDSRNSKDIFQSHLMPEPSLNSKLSQIVKAQNFKKTTNKQGELRHLEKLNEKIIKFISRTEILKFSEFGGYAELHSSEGIKIFEGYFENGKREGYGIQYHLDGKILYEGYFSNNIYHGWGELENYRGEFSQGKRNGWGIYESKGSETSSAVRYQGLWKDDKFQGIGALNVYGTEIKKFLNEQSVSELGQSQAKYVGQWNQNKIEGVGKLMSKNAIYSGQFINGLYEGNGKIKQSEKEQVSGIFRYGKMVAIKK